MSDVTVPTKNEKLTAWVDEVSALTQPDSVYWCDGSAEEYDRLCQLLVDHGTFRKLSEAKRPNSYLGWWAPYNGLGNYATPVTFVAGICIRV